MSLLKKSSPSFAGTEARVWAIKGEQDGLELTVISFTGANTSISQSQLENTVQGISAPPICMNTQAQKHPCLAQGKYPDPFSPQPV